jgi:hypothetical protein
MTVAPLQAFHVQGGASLTHAADDVHAPVLIRLYTHAMQPNRRLMIHLLQDVLRLLNLWFRYGALEEVKHELEEGFRLVPIDTWLVVVPQMMARLHTAESEIIHPLTELLIKIGRNHPQSLMYPLLVRARLGQLVPLTAASGSQPSLPDCTGDSHTLRLPLAQPCWRARAARLLTTTSQQLFAAVTLLLHSAWGLA